MSCKNCILRYKCVYLHSDMKIILTMIVAAVMWGGFLSEAEAQKYAFQHRADSMLAARYYKTSYDTNYVVRPMGRLTLKLRLNQSGNNFRAKGTVDDKDAKANLKTDEKTTVSIGASYRGISASLAVNPAKLKGLYKDYELNFNYYSSRFGLDFSYQRSESLAGDMEYDGGTQSIETGDVMLKMVYVTGYYVFNNRRFSLPAAFSQSYIQRHSAGSWLAGISYQGGTIKTTDALKERNADAPDTRLFIGHFGIGGGYGYNLVAGRKWLFHLSVMPTLVVYTNNNMTVNGERQNAKHIRFNMMFNERAAIVYNFSPRYFAAATLTVNNSAFADKNMVVNQSKWRIRATAGMRL